MAEPLAAILVTHGRPCLDRVRLVYTLPHPVSLELLEAMPGGATLELQAFSVLVDGALDHATLRWPGGRCRLTAAVGGDRLDVAFALTAERRAPIEDIVEFELSLRELTGLPVVRATNGAAASDRE